jgi:polar amino acid transport system substrate-binding protein
MRKVNLWLAVIVAVVLVLSVGVLAGCSSSETTTTTAATDTSATTATTAVTGTINLVSPGKLLAGSDTSFPPMESMNGTTAEGFDVDLMDAIAKKLGLQMVFKTEVFDTLIPTLKAGGKFDIIASSMTITDARKKEIDFSSPYIDSNQSIAVRKDSTIKSETDLSGKKVGVQSGTTGEAWAKENLAGASMVPFKTATEAFSSLQAGNVEAVVNDLPVSAFIVKDPARGLKIIMEIPTGEQYGFGISKDNPALLAAVNKALDELMKDGTYNTIYQKWFGTSPSSATTTSMATTTSS